MARAASGLPTRMTASVAATSTGASSRCRGSNSIPTETKKSTAKASRIGRASVAARRLNSDRPTTIPARNAPSAIETPKSLRRSDGDAEGEDEDGQREQLARAGGGDAVEQPGDEPPPPTRNVSATSAATLTSGEPDGRAAIAAAPAPARAEDGRQQHQHEDREQVLDDEPADGDVAGRRVQVVVVGQHADQHDGAGDRDRHAEDDARPTSPSRTRAPTSVPEQRSRRGSGRARRAGRPAARRAAPRGGTAGRRRTSAG